MKIIWDVEELVQCWSLGFEDLELLKSKLVRNHLGFVTQLRYYSLCDKFPQCPSDIPDTALHYVAAQLEIYSSRFNEHDWGGRTGKRHHQEILAFLGNNCVSEAAVQDGLHIRENMIVAAQGNLEELNCLVVGRITSASNVSYKH